MKKLVTLILLVFTISTYAQQKGADKIIIKNDKSASDNFIMVKLLLAEKGIEIASTDNDIKQIKTGVTSVTKYGAGAYYILFCKDKEIQLRGFFNTGLELNGIVKDTDSFKQIVNRGMKGSLFSEAWNAMNGLGKEIGGDITYEGVIVKIQTKNDDVY